MAVRVGRRLRGAILVARLRGQVTVAVRLAFARTWVLQAVRFLEVRMGWVIVAAPVTRTAVAMQVPFRRGLMIRGPVQRRAVSDAVEALLVPTASVAVTVRVWGVVSSGLVIGQEKVPVVMQVLPPGPGFRDVRASPRRASVSGTPGATRWRNRRLRLTLL